MAAKHSATPIQKIGEWWMPRRSLEAGFTRSPRRRWIASRANPNDHHSHRETDSYRATKRDHDISEQTLS
jgi:hypothetical protein